MSGAEHEVHGCLGANAQAEVVAWERAMHGDVAEDVALNSLPVTLSFDRILFRVQVSNSSVTFFAW